MRKHLERTNAPVSFNSLAFPPEQGPLQKQLSLLEQLALQHFQPAR